MSITADEVRRLIIDHDAARPRSQQTHIGPSDLSSPCDRKLVYHLAGVPRVVPNEVNLAQRGPGMTPRRKEARRPQRLGKRGRSTRAGRSPWR